MIYFDNDILCAAGDSIVGRVRAANEDSCGYGSTPNGYLFVVCDGMGGHVGGAVASKIAVDSILDYLKRQKYDDVPAALKVALEYANIQILGRAKENPDLSGMGTTACVLLIEDEKAWIAHVGDSRIYLYSSSSAALHRITKDHSFVQGLVDSGQLDDRDAENHPRKNVILKALGLRPDVVVDVEANPVLPAKGDVFLICSDGLSGMVDDDALEQILKEDYALEVMLEAMINDANEPGKGKDNITLQLVRINKSGASVSSFPDYNPNWRKAKIQGRGSRQAFVSTGEFDSPVNLYAFLKRWKYAFIMTAVFILAIITVLICLPDGNSQETVDHDTCEEWKESIKEVEREIAFWQEEEEKLTKNIEELKGKELKELDDEIARYEAKRKSVRDSLDVKSKALKDLRDSEPVSHDVNPERRKHLRENLKKLNKKGTDTKSEMKI